MTAQSRVTAIPTVFLLINADFTNARLWHPPKESRRKQTGGEKTYNNNLVSSNTGKAVTELELYVIIQWSSNKI